MTPAVTPDVAPAAAGRTGRGGRPRAAAAVALALCAAALGALIGFTTPWSPLGHRVPGGAVPPDPARDFTTAEIARERAYHAAVHPPAWTSLAVGLLVAAVLAATPAGARLADAAARLTGRRAARRPAVRVAVAAVAVVGVGRACTVPFDAWSHAVQRRYGLATQDWLAWSADQLKGLAVTLALAVPVLLMFRAVARRAPRWWWAPFAAAGAAIVLVASFAYPVVVEPLFARFHPLPAGPLRASLLDLARADGVGVDEVLVADASRRTTTLNAYVSGFGASRRIVLYDTLLRERPDEIRLVVAHELGHVRNDDVLRGTVEGAVGFAAGVCLGYLVLTSPRVLRRAGAGAVHDPRAVALLLGFVAWASFGASPLQNLVSRHVEARADVHALDLTRDPGTFVRAERALAVRGLSSLDPAPVVYALFATHPTGPERIATARDWARVQGAPEPPAAAPGAAP